MDLSHQADTARWAHTYNLETLLGTLEGFSLLEVPLI